MDGKPELKTPLDILELALAKEKQAHDFYADLVNHCDIAMVRDLAERLQNEEYRHMRLIEQMMTRMRLGRDPV